MVVTGISGIGLGRVVDLVSKEVGAAVAKFEDFVEDEFKAPIYHVAELLLVDYKRTAGRFERAFTKMVESLRGSKYAVIAMHSMYYRRSNIVSNPAIGYLARLGAEVSVIDYFDDYYHVLHRLATRIAHGETPGVASFQVIDPAGLLYWRSAQESVSRLIPLGGGEAYVYASKHTREGHLRLFSYILGIQPDEGVQYRSAYISHPITKLREYAIRHSTPLSRLGEVTEIEKFKQELERACPNLVVFSPTAIDELILSPETNTLQINITRDMRWPHPENRIHEYPYPVDLSSELFNEYLYPVDETVKNTGYLSFLKTLIETSIERRDLGYVSQADFVIAYRPTMFSEVHMGVETEIKTAVAMSKPVYSIIPAEERDISYKLFRFEYPLSSLEELLYILKCSRR